MSLNTFADIIHSDLNFNRCDAKPNMWKIKTISKLKVLMIKVIGRGLGRTLFVVLPNTVQGSKLSVARP